MSEPKANNEKARHDEIQEQLEELMQQEANGEERKEVITITLKGDLAFLYRGLMLSTKEDKRGLLAEKMFKHGLMEASEALLSHLGDLKNKK